MSKGICFTEPLFHRVVKGEKTQTRRVINPEPIIKNDWFIDEIEGWKNSPFGVVSKYSDCEPERFEIMQLLKPKYQVGEEVYLKEPYSIIADYEKGLITKYKFDYPPTFSHKWSNKLFMPESAARYFIEITAVRAERLQDISYTDCMKEGVISRVAAVYPYELLYQIPEVPNYYATARQAYASLINRINGKGTWDKNPFVWVYDFRLIER